MLSNDAGLLYLIATGNEEAFKTIYNHYFPPVHSYIKRIILNTDTAFDLTQEVFLRLWKHREELREMERPATWLYTVAGNQAFNHHRRQILNRKITKGLAGETSYTIEGDLEGKQLYETLLKAISLLPPQRRKIYQLCRDEGLGRREIAERLGISENTVRNQMVDATQFLKQYMMEHAGLALPLVLLFPLKMPF